jgi:hypothetical protein
LAKLALQVQFEDKRLSDLLGGQIVSGFEWLFGEI